MGVGAGDSWSCLNSPFLGFIPKYAIWKSRHHRTACSTVPIHRHCDRHALSKYSLEMAASSHPLTSHLKLIFSNVATSHWLGDGTRLVRSRVRARMLDLTSVSKVTGMTPIWGKALKIHQVLHFSLVPEFPEIHGFPHFHRSSYILRVPKYVAFRSSSGNAPPRNLDSSRGSSEQPTALNK